MSRAPAVPPPGFNDLPVEDVIAAHPKDVPVPGWHTKILNRRLAEYENHPDEGVTWEDFRAELRAETKKP